MNKIYCISGMGCDHRVFKRLRIRGYELVPLPWVPYSDDDDLPAYAARMAAAIINEKDVILLGLSFGGMLAVEISKLMALKKVILVSSAKTHNELPEPGKLARFIVRRRLIPPFFFSVPNRSLMAIRGIVPIRESISQNSFTAINGKFMQWALKVIMDWRNTEYPECIAHIHGTMDVVILPGNVNATYKVKGGTHLLVYSKAREVGNIIEGILRQDQ